MLPSITAGSFGITSSRFHASHSEREAGTINKRETFEPAKDEVEETTCTTLPFISEGSMTSLVSRKSGKSVGKEKGVVQDKGGGGGEKEEGMSVQDQESSGLKTTQLQLDCDLRSGDRGFCPQSINPRLTMLNRPPQLPLMGLHMMNTSERLTLQQTVGLPVESMQRKKKQIDRQGYLTQFGGKAVLNNRYTLPSFSGRVSPSKGLSSILLQVTGPPIPVPPKKNTVKPTGAAVHSRCCCRHHKQSGSESYKTITLESRSSDSLITVQSRGPNSKGSLSINRLSGFKNEPRVKPTDRPPPKKQPATNGMSVIQLRRKSKRTNVLTSDSSSSIQDQSKRRKESPPKIPSRGGNRFQTKVKETTSSTEPEISLDIQPEATVNVSIHVESSVNESTMDKERDLVEDMDVELEDKGNLLDKSAEQPDSSDSISVRSSTAGGIQRAATPRLLKVNAEQKTALSSLSPIFRKLDADCDGHLSFAELARSLPQDLTRQQINYLKKIYVIACESTYFGLEEFTATHQMCDLWAKSSPLVSNAFSGLDSSSLDFWLKTYMDSFSNTDKNQSGVIDMLSFQNMLASVMNVHPDSFILQRILANLNKSKDDTISGVELLAFIPYFAVAAPKDT